MCVHKNKIMKYKIYVYHLYIIITLTTTFNRNNRKESLTTLQNARQSSVISVRDSLLKCLYETFARIHSSHSCLYLIELETSNAAGTHNAQLSRCYLSIVGMERTFVRMRDICHRTRD